jgi:hypothetical protein
MSKSTYDIDIVNKQVALSNALLTFLRVDSYGDRSNLKIEQTSNTKFTSVTLISKKPNATTKQQPGTNIRHLVQQLNALQKKYQNFGEIKLGTGEESNTLFLTTEQVQIILARSKTKGNGVSGGGGGGGGGEEPSKEIHPHSTQKHGQVEPGKGSGHGSGK